MEFQNQEQQALRIALPQHFRCRPCRLELLDKRMHLSEHSANNLNQTEIVALLITMGDTFVDGICNVFRKVEGSCSILVLTEDGIIAARDALARPSS